MSDMRRKCVAATLSLAMTSAILFSLAWLAESYGVFSWMDAADSLTVISAPAHAA
jgi:hypothetical protein